MVVIMLKAKHGKTNRFQIRWMRSESLNMNQLDLDGYFVQRGIAEFSIEVKTILSRIAEDIETERSKGKVHPGIGDGVTDDINLIPSKSNGSCHQVLVGICYDKDNLEERIRECLDHVAINCSGINKEIFFLTTQWNSGVVNKFNGYIEALRKNGLLINLIYVTSKGFVLMPV